MQESERLNPRFDGAFLNFNARVSGNALVCLNPRFDGAFLNSQAGQQRLVFCGS